MPIHTNQGRIEGSHNRARESYFQYGQTKNAAQFSKTCQALSKHVAVYFKHGRPAAVLAILSLVPPVCVIPSNPGAIENPIIMFNGRICGKNEHEGSGLRITGKSTGSLCNIVLQSYKRKSSRWASMTQ